MNKRYVGILIPLLLTTLSGCLDFDRWDTRYKVSKDLSGQMSLQVTRIHSNEETVPAQEKEMKDLYQNFIDTMAGFNQHKIFDKIRGTLTDKTPLQCSGKVQAHFPEFNARTLDMVHEDFQVTREKGGIRFELSDTQEANNSLGDFTLIFEGDVLFHNAHRVDPNTGALTWELSKIKDTGILFTLKTS